MKGWGVGGHLTNPTRWWGLSRYLLQPPTSQSAVVFRCRRQRGSIEKRPSGNFRFPLAISGGSSGGGSLGGIIPPRSHPLMAFLRHRALNIPMRRFREREAGDGSEDSNGR